MVPAASWSHHVVLAAEPLSPSRARAFVGLHLEAHGLPQLVDDVRLVVSELATNAVSHARTPFTVTLARDDGSVRLAVDDDSPSVPVRGEPNLMGTGGRGLLLIELLSHEWGASTHRNGTKTVWASFDSRVHRATPDVPQTSGSGQHR